MIDRSSLLSDLKGLLRRLEADLRQRAGELPEIQERLRAEHRQAKEEKRTAQAYAAWLQDEATQMAAAWVLGCVFARFLEDNDLVEPPRLAGPGSRLQRARDEHELYFRAHPRETDREYLLSVFEELAGLPGTAELFGAHWPVRWLPNWLGPDAAGELLRFFQKIDADSGRLVHDFSDPERDTRFLGDLYQDLSEAARKKYALLQTPEFVEEFILERTLDPAVEEFGLEGFRMIDPACGSGHFLLGSFRRLLECWRKREPDAKAIDLTQRALDSVHGVDINPYAVAIARFRLLLKALQACGIARLQDTPAFRLNLACGDSLLHGSGALHQAYLGDWSPIQHVYHSEDLPLLQRILQPGRYHAVVANPPYITVKDKAANTAYRERYSACHRQYSMSVPFMQRVFGLAVAGGWTGQITANSFMKREFGKKLIEEFFPKVDLTHVIDTSGAYIPGHGTPTVILLGRHQGPVSSTVRTVMGIRGEPSTPVDAAKGLVWSAVATQVDNPGHESEFVSVADSARPLFEHHPWTLRGGGAVETKLRLEAHAERNLGSIIDEIGRTTHTGEDDVYYLPARAAKTRGVFEACVPLVVGENVRDFQICSESHSLFPYDRNTGEPRDEFSPSTTRHFWFYRTNLKCRRDFGQTILERGLRWFDHSMFFSKRYRAPLSIAFAFVATHNHFVLDRGGKVFKQSAPVIKLPPEASEEEHLGLLGLLNSSSGAFWMRQVFHDKGGGGIGGGIATEGWEHFFEYDGTKIREFPLPSERPMRLARSLDLLAHSYSESLPWAALSNPLCGPSSERLIQRRSASDGLRIRMLALQEELDWHCYTLYGLLSQDLTSKTDPPSIQLGERAFEIAMARRIKAGELETTWFERHGSTPITEIPDHWPEDYRHLVARRIQLIESDRNIGLIEQSEYKRRWNTESWESQQERALREWLLGRLESYFDFDGRMNEELRSTARLEAGLHSTERIADAARKDDAFLEVGEIYTDDPAFDVAGLVAELVDAESVPLLPALRYKPGGLRKRRQWEKTWELQRREDAIDARCQLPREDPDYLSEFAAKDLKAKEIGEIPVPPKYVSGDFQSNSYWKLRGKLDVPKERWVSFPYCEGEDGALVVAWAGCDHLQLARAISAYAVQIQEKLGGRDDPRLVPLLGCLLELIPWLKQWHNEVDPEFQMRMGDYFEGFVKEEARQLGMTLEEVRAWEPPKRTARRKGGRRRRK